MNPDQLRKEFWERLSDQNQLQRLRLWLLLEWDVAQEGWQQSHRPARKFVYVENPNGKPIIIGSVNALVPLAFGRYFAVHSGITTVAVLAGLSTLAVACLCEGQRKSILQWMMRPLRVIGQGAIFFAYSIEQVFFVICRRIRGNLSRHRQ